MRKPTGFPARLAACEDRARQQRLDREARQVAWSRFNPTGPDPNVVGSNVRVLMENFEWKVPKSERPKLAPPPQERDPRLDKLVNSLNGLMA